MEFLRRGGPVVVALSLSLVVVLGAGAARAGEDAVSRAYLDGDLAGAEKLLEAELAAGEARPSRHLFLGRVRFRLGKWEGAQAVLEELLRRDAANPQARELLGQVLFRRGRLAEALPLYEESLRQAPRDELRLEMAEALLGLGRSNDALEQLTRVTGGSGAWPRAHYLAGSIRLESGLGHWAANQFWIARSLGCREPDLSLKLARAFCLEGRMTGPLFLAGPVKDGAAGRCTDGHILVRRAGAAGGDLWYAAGADSGLYQAETAVEAAGVSAADDALLLAARCWLAAGNLDRARERAAAVKARSAEAFLLLAGTALAAGDAAGLRRLFAEWPADGRPGADETIGCLVRAALLAQVQSDPVGALAFLQEAERLSPGRSEVLRPTIDVLLQLGRRQEAAGKARLLAELHPDSPGARLIAGRHGISLDELDRAGGPVIEKKEPSR